MSTSESFTYLGFKLIVYRENVYVVEPLEDIKYVKEPKRGTVFQRGDTVFIFHRTLYLTDVCIFLCNILKVTIVP